MTHPDPDLSGAGLSATGRTAGDLEPGDESPGTTYGAPGGTGNEAVEGVGAPVQEGATSEGDVEGA